MSNDLIEQAKSMTIGSDKFALPMPPTFDNLAAQQTYEKQRLSLIHI